MIWNINIEEQTDFEILVDTDLGSEIILYNDDVNTFDHVIHCLVKYCKHSSEQAEQCSLLVHYKGKCSVKKGSEIELIPICSALQEKGLSATIEQS